MKVHPLAEIFPLPNEEKIAKLTESIARIGLIDSGVLHPDGRLLDGRCRKIACERAKKPFRTEPWRGPGSIAEWVVAKNLDRRHLTPDQQLEAAVKALPFFEQEARARQLKGTLAPDGAKASEVVARQFGVAPRTLEKAKAVATKAPELLEKVRAGQLSWSKAERISKGAATEEEDTDERYTTMAQYQLCLRIAGLKKLELDVAACDEAHVCERYWTKSDSGLLKPWKRPWWCNPPWSDIRPWVEEGFRAPKPGLMLLPAWTDREWWQELIEPARDLAHAPIWTRFLPRAPFGHPGNREAKGVGQPEFWCVLVGFHLPLPKKARDMGWLQRVDVPRGSTKGSKTA